MIVRNESAIITRCLDSMIGIIDYLVITDTGSTDSTVQLIKTWTNNAKIIGQVYKNPWVNFSVNRTQSINNAKDFLTKHSIPLNKVYLIFVDADMIIENINFSKNDLKLDYYLVKQYNEYISYYNIRLARADLKLSYKSVTHEYLDIQLDNPTNSKLLTIQINDIGDGGCKTLQGACSTDKFQRDIKLLLQGIKDEPDNSRYYFYLAQSYKDSGDTSNAIKYYTQRVKMGGWIEEIGYSYLMLGQLVFDLKPTEAIEYLTKSFESFGKYRAEPLYWLSKIYSNKQNYSKAYNYLVQAIKLPYPESQVLFINDSIYNYDLYKELSIVAFYVGKKDLGLLTCDYVKFIDKKYNFDNNNNNLNQTFYLKPLSKKLDLLNITYNLPEKFNLSNCCLKLVNSEICEGIIRTVNYIYNNNVRTENYWCSVNIKSNKIIQKIKIDFTDSCYMVTTPHNSQVKGLEDGRFIIYNGKLYASFTSLEYGVNNLYSMVLAHFNSNFQITHIIPLTYNNNIVQKNWLPVEYKGKLCFIYSFNPFILLHVNIHTGFCTKIITATYNYNFSSFCGSAGPVWISSDKQLILIHEVAFDRTVNPVKRIYSHRFLEYDENFHLLRISQPFYFLKLGIEFCLTLMYCEYLDTIICYHTIQDNHINKVEIKLNDIKWLSLDLKKNILSFFTEELSDTIKN